MLNVPPKTYNKKHTTTGDHVDRRILQYSRATVLPHAKMYWYCVLSSTSIAKAIRETVRI